MNELLGGRNRRLLFRSYLLLVGGLLLVAIVLDLGFGYLQSRHAPDVDQWLESTLNLVEFDLAQTPPANRAARADELGEVLGIGVQLLDRDDVHMALTREQPMTPLVDADGDTSYLRDAASLDVIIRLGPIAAPRESLVLDLLPPLFYLSIFIVVALWVRPILRDINVISGGAQRFAADYREPPTTAEHTTQLTSLAKNLDEMAARLSGVLRSQKELIAALSHEMRTPLARIRFALAVIGEKADAATREKLSAINGDVEEIDNLVASMLSYARLDHPDIEMRRQAVPAPAWLRSIVDKAPAGSLQLELITDRAPDEVSMDPRLMELALSNLVVNATRYARACVRCSMALDGGHYLLSVEDDGQGIPEDQREAIFKAFTRIDDSRNRETGGYGLGLAVVARVAELHGGDATADASPALGGARFSIRWPVPAD